MHLSPYHKIFYYEWKLAPDSSKYNIVFDQTFSHNLDINRLRKALHRLISDYLILNSHVKHMDEHLAWTTNTEINELEYFSTPYISEQILHYVSMPFSIETHPLYRFALFTESDGNYRFIAVLHHLLIDGNSFDVFINEISNYYNSPTHTANHTLLEQKNILENANYTFSAQLKEFGSQYQCFWDKQLAGIESVDLRWAKSETHLDQIKEHRFHFNKTVTTALFQVINDLDITVFQYSQCILAILLHKYTSKNEIVLNYPIAIKGGIPLISGACVNTTLSIYEFNTATTIIDLFQQNKNLIQSVKSVGNNAIHYPINDMINNENKDLLNVMFAQTNLKNTAISFVGVATQKVNSEFNIDLPTKIIFELEKQEHTLNIRVRYNLLKIDEAILSNFISQYERIFLNILNDLSAGISKKISQYSVLSKPEYDQIVNKWSKTSKSYPSNKLVHELFEEQVEKTPSNMAVVYQETKLTYIELNRKSNQFAHYLRIQYKIKNGDLIALYLNRSEHMIIAILGILKAGGAYVPIDVTSPEKRTRRILEDIGTKVLITDSHSYDSIYAMCISDETIGACNGNIPIVAIDTNVTQVQLQQQPIDNPKLNIDGSSLAYVMYTSGTIGKPKGVMLEQYSVAIRIMSMINRSSITENSRYLFKTNYVFDVSFSDIFMTLLSGASLYISRSVFDIEEICHLIAKNNITVCHFVPSQLEVINDYLLTKNLFSTLQTINVSGEKFHKSLICGNTHITYVNYYGPTETGEVSCDVMSSKHQLITHPKLGTIGYPLDQSTLYILDSHLNPLPIGAIGELYIGGVGLARGYLNQPELTQKSFIPNPFQNLTLKYDLHNLRLYKTGDLVRHLPDGNIEYIGRSDNQVKIRGFRVELAEIETKLSNYQGIKHVVVLAQEQNTHLGISENYLVAYYVSNTELDENLMLDYLAEELPEYMLPSIFVYLEHLPLTANGKLNTQALPRAQITTNRATYAAPRNDLEKKICTIYANVLKLAPDQISIHDNFFKLGGHSISAIHLTFKLQHYLDVSVNDIFEYKTPAQIAQFIPVNNINLVDKLEQMKLMYSKFILGKEANLAIDREHALYQQQVTSFTFDNKIKPSTGILLTGATGYLGCHILHELLFTTNHVIYIPIRLKPQEDAFTRLSNKFRYYFEIDLNSFDDRIHVFRSDLSKENLDLDQHQYEKLTNNINSIIHSAALVKHYGSNTEFHLENVQTTINLLELAKLTANKDFHYISTIGVFTNQSISDSEYNIFTEEPIDDRKANIDNIYTKTKYEGEQVVLKYREYGIKTNIYRVGNLAINAVTLKTQENIEDNAFFQRTRTILELGIIPRELSELEISPVDSTAKAVTLLCNQVELYNQIYHVFNPKKSSLYELFNHKTSSIKLVSASIFIDAIKTQLTMSPHAHQIELFALHQWGLYFNIGSLAQTIIFQDKTTYILDKLGFQWPNITSEMLLDITQKCQNNPVHRFRQIQIDPSKTSVALRYLRRDCVSVSFL